MAQKTKATKRGRGRPISVGATQTVTMTMPPALVATMDAMAARAGITRSEVARRLIVAGLKRGKV